MRWPNRDEVDAAVRQWAQSLVESDENVLAIGYFGSYARGDYGVGSDLDVVVIVRSHPLPFHQRSANWDFKLIPVPVEALVYTFDEWNSEPFHQLRMYDTLCQETVWLKQYP